MDAQEVSTRLKSAVDISRAAQVFGWMNAAELEWLGKQALEHLVIVELGCYLGRSTRALGDNTLGKVYAIDDWMGADAGDYTRPLTAARSDQMYEEFLMSVRDLVDAGLVVPVRSDHDAMQNLQVSPDMVFIDGDHSYNGCRRDIYTWYPRLAPGGIICGHDIGHGPVHNAVRDSLKDWHQVGDGTTIWYSIKPSEGEAA